LPAGDGFAAGFDGHSLDSPCCCYNLLPRFTQSIINLDGSRPITHTGTCTHVRVLHIFSTTLKGRHHE
jgi:hypothetical protein